MSPKKDNRGTNSPDLHNGAARSRRSNQPSLDRLEALQDFYDFSPVGYLTLDGNGNILDANLTISMMIKTTLAEMIGQSFYDYVHRDDRDTLYSYLRSLFKNKRPKTCELRLQNADENMIPVVLDGLLAEDRKGRQVYRSVVMDITERKQMEEDLRRSRDEQELRVKERTAELKKMNEELKNEIEKRKKFEADLKLKSKRILKEQEQRKYLSKKLVELLERERHEMSRTLHDEVGQLLTKLNMDLDYVIEKLNEQIPIKAGELEKIQKNIMESMDFISEISGDLRPHILENLGLVPAIRNMLHKISETSRTKFHLDTKVTPELIDREKALAIYRIIQESVTNCLKYARANNIYINLNRNEHLILLAIEDDGVGFEHDDIKVKKGGRQKLGIMIMNERAVQAGGEFRIDSQVGKGAKVIAEIPIK